MLAAVARPVHCVEDLDRTLTGLEQDLDTFGWEGAVKNKFLFDYQIHTVGQQALVKSKFFFLSHM